MFNVITILTRPATNSSMFFSISVIFLIVCSRKSFMVETKAKFSIMIDESTSVANVKLLILYVGLLFNGEVCTYFLALTPLTIVTAAAIESSLSEFKEKNLK